MLLKHFDFKVKPFENIHFDPTILLFISDLCYSLSLGRIVKSRSLVKRNIILYFCCAEIIFYGSLAGVLNSCLLL